MQTIVVAVNNANFQCPAAPQRRFIMYEIHGIYGSCASCVFLHHIIQKYDTLCDTPHGVTLFCTNDIYERISETENDTSINDIVDLTAQSKFSYNCVVARENATDAQKSWYEAVFEMTYPKQFYATGDVFAVRHDVITSRTASYYKRLLRDANSDVSIMQHAWMYVFNVPLPHKSMFDDIIAFTVYTPNYYPLFARWKHSLPPGFVARVKHFIVDATEFGLSTPSWYTCVRFKMQEFNALLRELPDDVLVLCADSDIYFVNHTDALSRLTRKTFRDNPELDMWCMRENKTDSVNGGFYVVRNTHKIRMFMQEVLRACTRQYDTLAEQTFINRHMKDAGIKSAYVPDEYVAWAREVPDPAQCLFHHAVCCKNVAEKLQQQETVLRNIPNAYYCKDFVAHVEQRKIKAPGPMRNRARSCYQTPCRVISSCECGTEGPDMFAEFTSTPDHVDTPQCAGLSNRRPKRRVVRKPVPCV